MPPLVHLGLMRCQNPACESLAKWHSSLRGHNCDRSETSNTWTGGCDGMRAGSTLEDIGEEFLCCVIVMPRCKQPFLFRTQMRLYEGYAGRISELSGALVS